ncbi:hypothetical protein Ancab_024536 [Ancistrocladus abbreviatus]
MDESASPPPSTTDLNEDSILSKSEFLTRQEVLKRRLRRIKLLSKCYRDYYWSLMEELRLKHREYYWIYGKSPFKEDGEVEEEEKREKEKSCVDGIVQSVERNENNDTGNVILNGGTSVSGLGFGTEDGFNQCAFPGCKSKAMALTSYCHPHILSDSKQVLYKACKFVIKSGQTGSVLCGKPILRSTIPSFCPSHFQKSEKNVQRALKKAGLSIASSTKLAPKFHLVVAEVQNPIRLDWHEDSSDTSQVMPAVCGRLGFGPEIFFVDLFSCNLDASSSQIGSCYIRTHVKIRCSESMRDIKSLIE